MALIDDLKEKLATVDSYIASRYAQIEMHENAIDDLSRQRLDLHVAIVALQQAAEAAPAAVTEPEPEPEPHDDASEFAEEGYAPVTQAEPPAMEGVAFVDGKWTIPGPSFEELDDDGLEPGPVDEASHPMAAYVPATDPQADALAKAADYYSPESVAERNRFDPFRMFKREGDE